MCCKYAIHKDRRKKFNLNIFFKSKKKKKKKKMNQLINELLEYEFPKLSNYLNRVNILVDLLNINHCSRYKAL